MGITCVTPNIAKVGKSYKVTAKVIINFSDVYKGEKDHSIIHELNHLYELALKEVSDSTYKTIFGWDIVEEKIDSQEITDEEDKRKYELLNEIINEKIAKEISKMMADKNIKIFDERVNADYQNKTGYDQTNYIVDEFFETFKKEIKASRKNGNVRIIFDAVGRENFEDLNKLFQIHLEKIGGLKYYSLREDLRDNRETERTRAYFYIKEKRDKILKDMKEHYKLYIEGLKKEKNQNLNSITGYGR